MQHFLMQLGFAIMDIVFVFGLVGIAIFIEGKLFGDINDKN